MRVFIDANTLVSGIVFSGKEHLLLKSASAHGIVLVTSDDVLGEVGEVIRRKFPRQAALADEFVRLAEFRVIPR